MVENSGGKPWRRRTAAAGAIRLPDLAGPVFAQRDPTRELSQSRLPLAIDARPNPGGKAVSDDYSTGFHRLRTELVDSRGARHVDVVRTLQPDYARVYRDIAFGYGWLAAAMAACIWLPAQSVPRPVAVLVGAALIGYWIAYLQLFMHEAAHFNLAPGRLRSDRICNLLIAWMVGTSVGNYRKVHFQHHRALGTVDDSEFSYFFPLNLMFLGKSLFAVRSIEVLLSRWRYLSRSRSRTRPRSAVPDRVEPAADEAAGSARGGIDGALIGGLLAHLGIVMAAWLAGSVTLALAWLLGVGMVFPFLGATRQLLEHRRDGASSAVDYRTVDHGAFTRLFGSGAFASTFGAAGFNRHLLHHWEPQVSYTRLEELEAFLADTATKSDPH